MNNQEKLKEWMDSREFSFDTLSESTGDSYNNVYLMATGRRPIGDAFKWRFLVAFGQSEAVKIFDELKEKEPVLK